MQGMCRLSVTANRLICSLLISVGAMAGCSGTTTGGCTLPPVPANVSMSRGYPIPSATNVPAVLADANFEGEPNWTLPHLHSTLDTVALDSPTAAPSLLPTPYATPLSRAAPYFERVCGDQGIGHPAQRQ